MGAACDLMTEKFVLRTNSSKYLQNKFSGSIISYKVQFKLFGADTIPGPWNQEEMNILRKIQRQNEEIRELRRRMEIEYSRGCSPPCERVYAGLHPGPSWKQDQSEISAGMNSGKSEGNTVDERTKWEREKSRLEAKIRRLEAMKKRRGTGEIRYGAGPCSVQGDEPHFFGMSTRMLIANHEGSLMNDHNEMIELQRDLELVMSELERLGTTSEQSVCEMEKHRKKSIVHYGDDVILDLLSSRDIQL
ncbi:hypothetical protein QAD02_010105 [Eretmocerus hayati]|uniref:Uncharacterized protein n=1 Tax=Eretmocerus hayati TaxID=131215 RepID=A0ACC2NDP9_9HYME|nr:hypothetical protein QAD02_010105 [Eretmocerus hayati]